MTRVAVLLESGNSGEVTYRAVSGRSQASGRTAGEALDALTAQLGPEEGATIVVRTLRADRFFDAEERRRLDELTALRQRVLDGTANWTPEEAAELERLVDAELLAATRRAEALAHDLGR